MDNDRDTLALPKVESTYEPPQVVDLGPIFEVTLGSSLGGADANGQGQH